MSRADTDGVGGGPHCKGKDGAWMNDYKALLFSSIGLLVLALVVYWLTGSTMVWVAFGITIITFATLALAGVFRQR